jgi:6-phosphogluconolactonase
MSEWRRFDNTAELDRELAQHIASALAADIASHGRASLALSGGGTPKNMFRQLSQFDLDWSAVWITLVDERWVAVDNPDSNEQLLRENLLQDKAAQAHFVSLKNSANDAADGLAEVAQRLAQMPRPFAMVVLGMGGDGHTASWFPQASNLDELLDTNAEQRIAATEPVTAPHQRITLTLAAVLDSREIVVHITGEEKKSVLERARENNYPIAAILEQHTAAATIWWAP